MQDDSNASIFSQREWQELKTRLELSQRQFQIVKLLCDGHKNYSAANELKISVNTVRTHLRQLYNKLGVNDRFELLCLLVKTNKTHSSQKTKSEKTN